MSVGAESWYKLCERLCAGFTYNNNYDCAGLPPLAVRLRTPTAEDVNMTDMNAHLAGLISTSATGQKRSRDDDDDDEIVLEDAFRFEKVCHESYTVWVSY